MYTVYTFKQYLLNLIDIDISILAILHHNCNPFNVSTLYSQTIENDAFHS